MNSTLADHITAWKRIGASDIIQQWILNGVVIPFSSVPETFVGDNRIKNSNEKDFVDSEVQRLLTLGYIEPSDIRPVCVNPLSCVIKKRGSTKYRLVTDLRYVNSHCRKVGYKNEDIRTIASIIEPNDYMISADLSDGFFHIPVNSEYRKYVGFQWNNVFYVWKVLPFGLGCSPYYFTKTIRPVITYLREQAVKLTVYVDDFFLCAQRKLITDHTDLLLQTLKDLGLNVNFNKSVLVPCQRIDHLGYNIRTDDVSGRPVISVLNKRLQRLRHDIRRTLNRQKITARDLARITGQCVSMAWAISPGKLLLRACYRLLASRVSWDSVLHVHSKDVQNELLWWLESSHLWNHHEVSPSIIDLQIITDASHIGYGAVLTGTNQCVSGEWNTRVSTQSSNYRELLAVLMAVSAFKDTIKDKHVEILSDNITTIAYINYKGGPSAELTRIAASIWQVLFDIGAYVTCKHIAGIQNPADIWSRIPDKNDWMLRPNLFRFIDSYYGPHTIDRFASLKSRQLPRFNSRYAEPESCGVDALAQTNWGMENNFVNPPFALLNRVLDTIVTHKAYATIIAPRWTSQPWFRKLQNILIAQPLRIPNNANTFRHMGNSTQEPRRNPWWKIYAWRVYGGKNC